MEIEKTKLLLIKMILNTSDISILNKIKIILSDNTNMVNESETIYLKSKQLKGISVDELNEDIDIALKNSEEENLIKASDLQDKYKKWA